MSEGAVKVAVHRLRQRYRELLHEEIGRTVGTPEEIEEEVRSLFAALGSKTPAKTRNLFPRFASVERVIRRSGGYCEGAMTHRLRWVVASLRLFVRSVPFAVCRLHRRGRSRAGRLAPLSDRRRAKASAQDATKALAGALDDSAHRNANIVPTCGADLAVDAAEGLCPQCLLKGVISSAHEARNPAPSSRPRPTRVDGARRWRNWPPSSRSWKSWS